MYAYGVIADKTPIFEQIIISASYIDICSMYDLFQKVNNYCHIIDLHVKTSEAYEAVNFQIGVEIYKSKLQ
jgi:hypothetical protein